MKSNKNRERQIDSAESERRERIFRSNALIHRGSGSPITQTAKITVFPILMRVFNLDHSALFCDCGHNEYISV